MFSENLNRPENKEKITVQFSTRPNFRSAEKRKMLQTCRGAQETLAMRASLI